MQGPNRGGVWRAAPNAANKNAMRAQRGRRGLISYGEVMPEKLTKSQKSQSKAGRHNGSQFPWYFVVQVYHFLCFFLSRLLPSGTNEIIETLFSFHKNFVKTDFFKPFSNVI